MALHLSVLLLFTGVTGIDCTIQTVSKVSVKAGRSISVPCLYESQYTDHVKYLCRGDHFYNCYTEVKTNQRNSSGKFSISDDKHQRIFTLTFNNQSVDDTHYWCVVERNDGSHDAKRFQLSVTRGSPQLSVDHQEITGFNGDDVTIHFKYNISGEIQWCTLGGSCVKEKSGSLNGARVTINCFHFLTDYHRDFEFGFVYLGGLNHLVYVEETQTEKCTVTGCNSGKIHM
ncbi:hypothetical protein D5F01_LYC17972 [Larimichthys crocea]|uniref:Immunoglobulin domain-containing protein n=1 Tax=Larimichthys crocea TaxID=215358 RepID=A0A6G0HZX5_LARCR|nr:hypothetical protein D5F01_LYC17972 [Larimichthys crocea]